MLFHVISVVRNLRVDQLLLPYLQKLIALNLIPVYKKIFFSCLDEKRPQLLAAFDSMGFSLSSQHITADHDLLYFGCSFVDLGDLRITHQALYMEFFYITISAMDLYGFVGYPLGDL